MEQILAPNTIKFKTPSGMEVTIREQDGGDDEIISKMKNATDGTAVNKFVASITVEPKVTANDVLKWKNKDKYYVLYRSRRFSLGDEITYKHNCSSQQCNKESNYDEDLKPFDFDFSDPNALPSGFKYQVTPYVNKEKTTREITLSSKKRIRYKYLDGLSEKALLALPKEEFSKNTELIVRNLEWYQEAGEEGGKWIKVQNFKIFSAIDMREIRADVKEQDMPFEAISEAKCPYCNTVDGISLLSQPDFFFPGEIS